MFQQFLKKLSIEVTVRFELIFFMFQELLNYMSRLFVLCDLIVDVKFTAYKSSPNGWIYQYHQCGVATLSADYEFRKRRLAMLRPTL